MKLVFLAVLLSPSLALDVYPEPVAQNIVTRFLNGILNDVFEHLSTKNVSIPLLDLADVGNLSNVEFGASGLNKTLDGIQSHGFKMEMSARRVTVGGQYHILHLNVPGLFPIFGKGDFSVELDGIELKTTLKVVRDYQNDRFNVTVPELVVQVQGSKVKIDNLMNDPHLADFLNELLTNLIPGLVPAIAEKLKEILPGPLSHYGTGIFKCLPLIQREKILECIKKVFFPSKVILEEVGMSLVEMLNGN